MMNVNVYSDYDGSAVIMSEDELDDVNMNARLALSKVCNIANLPGARNAVSWLAQAAYWEGWISCERARARNDVLR